jgi:hypothetical protein
MRDNLLNNHFILVGLSLAVLEVFDLCMCSFISARFLRALRQEANPFWLKHFGQASVWMLRMARVTPPAVARMAGNDEAKSVCDRYTSSFRRWRIAAVILVLSAVIAILMAGR